MKLKTSVARTLTKAGIGKLLNDEEKRTLRALSEWISLECPARAPREEGTWAVDVCQEEEGVWSDDDTLPNLGMA